MPMSSSELERTYRRIYRRLTICICMIYGAAVLAGLVAWAGGDGNIAGRISQAVQAAMASADTPGKPTRLAQPFRTVKAD